MRPSFTILELVIVIVIIGILASTISITMPNNNLQRAADNLIKNIQYTQSLALKDDKYQPFPIENNSTEYNRSKYWFKQWWQIRFTKNRNDPKDLWYEIFSDVPYNNSYNFDKVGNYPPKKNIWDIGYAKDPLTNKYLTGKCDTDNSHNYPPCDKIDNKLNLTKKYGIKEVLFNGSKISSSNSKRLIFDNFGNVFLDEGQKGDAGDINPVDINNRQILTKITKIKLCLDDPCDFAKDRCIQINITPTGFIFYSECE